MNVVDYLFEKSKKSDRDMVIGNFETISYKNIYKRIIALSDFLRKEIGQNKKILLMSKNSIFFITAYFGIMKSGNICVPLDPSIIKREDVLSHIIDSCDARICFVQKVSGEKLTKFKVRTINEKALENIVDKKYHQRSCIEEEGTHFDSERIAEILFTSGTTAFPKGVMLSHKNIIENTHSIIEYLKLTSDDIIEVVLPFFYCYGLSLLHTHVRAGGSIVLNNTFIFLKTVIDDLLKYKCTGFAGVPSHFQILLRKSNSFKTMEFPNLRYVTQAGGKLADTFIREFVDTFPDIKFYVMYGQTEATSRLSYLPAELVVKKIGSIGKGIPDVTLEVLNKNNKKVKKIGEIGEIVASGKNIMTGYLNDDQLTRQIIRDGKLYTEDLAVTDEEGYIYIVAREKEIIKVGGERISPQEIEEVIECIPEVIDCSIVGVEDNILGEAIKAFVVLNRRLKNKISEEYIKSFCGKKLSPQKIPRYIEFIDKIPVNSAGKKIRTLITKLSDQ